MTAAYSIRLFHPIFLTRYEWYHEANGYIIHLSGNNLDVQVGEDEMGRNMLISISTLILCSVIIGYLFSDIMVGIGVLTWTNCFEILSTNYVLVDIEFVSPIIRNLPVISSLFSMFITMIIINCYETVSKINYNLIYFNHYIKLNKLFLYFGASSYHGLFSNTIYNNVFYKFSKYIYNISMKVLDRGFLEFLGPYGSYSGTKLLYDNYKNLSYLTIPFAIFFLLFNIFFFVMYFGLYIVWGLLTLSMDMSNIISIMFLSLFFESIIRN